MTRWHYPAIRQRLTGGFLLLSSLLAVGEISQPATGADRDNSSLVRTESGPVRGFVENGVHEFLGIPYAAPPVGQLRWMPPQPPAPWSKPLDATVFGNTCPQNFELGVYAGPPSTTEDCLYLNVFTTSVGRDADNRGRREKNPVLVWIHGGGWFDGESNDYDASKLALGGPSGPTVVVTINYRLGLLGFLAHPALDAEGHAFADYGLMDLCGSQNRGRRRRNDRLQRTFGSHHPWRRCARRKGHPGGRYNAAVSNSAGDLATDHADL